MVPCPPTPTSRTVVVFCACVISLPLLGYATKRAHLDALGGIDGRMPFVVLADGRAADAHALAAGTAVVHDGDAVPRPVDETAGAAKDEDGEFVRRPRRPLEGVLDRGVILCVDRFDLVGPERKTQRLYVEPLAPLDGKRVCSAHLLVQGNAVAGIALAAGHGRRTVVEYAERARPGIVDGAEHARDARMGKGAIADHTDQCRD